MIIEEGFDLNLIYGTDYTYINSNTSKYKDIDNLHVELGKFIQFIIPRI
jgi:hypothetical protein